MGYYWNNRYKHIQDMLYLQQILSLPVTLYYKCRHRNVENNNNFSYPQHGDYTFNDKDALLWNYCWKVLSIENNSNKLSSSSSEEDDDDNTSNWLWESFKSSSIIQFFTKIIVLAFVFVWFVVGLVTFGLLLPPQVRNWIISSNIESNYSNGVNNNTNNTSSWKYTKDDNNQSTTSSTNSSSSNVSQENNKNNKMEEKLYYNMNKMEKQQRELMLKYDQVIMMLHDMNDNIVNSNNCRNTDNIGNNTHISSSAVKSKKRDVISASATDRVTSPNIEVCYSENTSII